MANKNTKRSTGKKAAKKPNRPNPRSAPAAADAAADAPVRQPAATRTNREKRHEERDRAKAAVAARQAQESRNARLVNVVIIGAVVVLVMGLGWWIWKDANKTVVKPQAMTADYGLLVGKQDATQKVVIYEDFFCGPCRQLEQSMNANVDAAAATGTVSVEYRPINQLGTDYSKNSAQAMWAVLEASGVDVAKKFHDLLYSNQPAEGGQGESEEWLADQARAAGSDRAAVLKALKDDTYEGLVEAATDEARSTMPRGANGSVGTPTVLINGEHVNRSTLSDIASQVVGVLSAATASTQSGSATPSGAPVATPSGSSAPTPSGTPAP